MEPQLKQRLVGVTVIFSLAVIFLPMLLDGSGNRLQHLKISIPLPPEIPSYEIVDEKIKQLKVEVEQLPQLEAVVVDELSDPVDLQQADKQKDDDKAEEEALEKAIQAATEELDKADPVKPAVKKSVSVKSKPAVTKVAKRPVGGHSWVLQVGSFSEKSKAYLQRDKIRKSGMAAVFIEKFKHNGIFSYRVRMGPFISRDKAQVIGNKVRAKYNIKGLVMSYKK
ncbi:MAG: SPOR domain-containing protein [Gammaproteobacteria bacterium]|nr:SPOR domain-containing protein [Gammaproteobacteria bacterium]